MSKAFFQKHGCGVLARAIGSKHPILLYFIRIFEDYKKVKRIEQGILAMPKALRHILIMEIETKVINRNASAIFKSDSLKRALLLTPHMITCIERTVTELHKANLREELDLEGALAELERMGEKIPEDRRDVSPPKRWRLSDDSPRLPSMEADDPRNQKADELEFLNDNVDQLEDAWLGSIDKMTQSRREPNIYFSNFNQNVVSDMDIMNYIYDRCYNEPEKISFLLRHFTWTPWGKRSLKLRQQLVSSVISEKTLAELEDLCTHSFYALTPVQKHLNQVYYLMSLHEGYIKYQYSDNPSASAIRAVRDLKLQDNAALIHYQQN